MERMQSTWENVVEMDLSESGIRPVTLRELGGMGLVRNAIGRCIETCVPPVYRFGPPKSL